MRARLVEFARSRYDRERMLAFLDFTWKRFVEDRCFQTAGALSFTSVFALVPVTAAVLGILAAFPGFGGLLRPAERCGGQHHGRQNHFLHNKILF